MISFDQVSFTYNEAERPTLHRVNLHIPEGELCVVVGETGTGKSTLLRAINGLVPHFSGGTLAGTVTVDGRTCETPPSSGQIVFENRDITGWNVTRVSQLGLTKSYQVNQLFNRLTVRENIEIAALAVKRGPFRPDLMRDMRRVPGLNQRVEETLGLVHLTRRADLAVSELAYGEKRRLEIGLALATKPSLLLLDEPLAGMSPRERVETVALLKSIRAGRTLVVIDHDMDAIFELAEFITVLSQGQILVEATPDEIRGNALVQEAYLGGMRAA